MLTLESKRNLLEKPFKDSNEAANSHSRIKRKVPVSKEIQFYKVVNQIDPVALKLLLSNITEESLELTTPSPNCCYNGGTCHVPTYKAEDRWCSCPANFTGRYCNMDVDECQFTDACSEHEVCQNTYGSYKCFCEEGFVRDGYKCIRKTNCLEDPCMNFADCVDREDGKITCICRLGYIGKYCEKGKLRQP
ncbi:protocadherin Fat 1 [Trichonephila inaurata madagascariensis]|uniref:Protocadherin Fat 1 n=1 Tax=Trichonephila inaurata madagascariensis TaxID=2747483 RepID=A0A8X7CR42_9ARAC|nr:protocadherin Fat 1 [Trichonephila inaurata madagascariensis]